MKEIWKDIEGFEGRYSVSSFGEIKSHIGNGRILKQKTDKYGYKCVCLRRDNKNFYRTVHRLVAKEFIENKGNLNTVNHIDSNKTNNHVNNLEWCSEIDNTYHHIKSSYVDSLCKLSEEQCKELVDLYLEGYDYKDLKEHFGTDWRESDLADLLKGRRYSHITGITEDVREKDRNYVLKDEQVLEILDLRHNHRMPLKTIAGKFGVKESQISRICSGIRRKNVYDRFFNKEGC